MQDGDAAPEPTPMPTPSATTTATALIAPKATHVNTFHAAQVLDPAATTAIDFPISPPAANVTMTTTVQTQCADSSPASIHGILTLPVTIHSPSHPADADRSADLAEDSEAITKHCGVSKVPMEMVTVPLSPVLPVALPAPAAMVSHPPQAPTSMAAPLQPLAVEAHASPMAVEAAPVSPAKIDATTPSSQVTFPAVDEAANTSTPVLVAAPAPEAHSSPLNAPTKLDLPQWPTAGMPNTISFKQALPVPRQQAEALVPSEPAAQAAALRCTSVAVSVPPSSLATVAPVAPATSAPLMMVAATKPSTPHVPATATTVSSHAATQAEPTSLHCALRSASPTPIPSPPPVAPLIATTDTASVPTPSPVAAVSHSNPPVVAADIEMAYTVPPPQDHLASAPAPVSATPMAHVPLEVPVASVATIAAPSVNPDAVAAMDYTSCLERLETVSGFVDTFEAPCILLDGHSHITHTLLERRFAMRLAASNAVSKLLYQRSTTGHMLLTRCCDGSRNR